MMAAWVDIAASNEWSKYVLVDGTSQLECSNVKSSSTFKVCRVRCVLWHLPFLFYWRFAGVRVGLAPGKAPSGYDYAVITAVITENREASRLCIGQNLGVIKI